MKQLNDEQITEILEAEKYAWTREQYCSEKIKEGFKIYFPNETELILDLDSREAYKNFLKRFVRLESEVGALSKKTYPSKTPGHFHVVVTLPFKVEDFERIALQAVLGSDPIKEMLSIYRIWSGDPFPTLLAMKPEVFNEEKDK